MYGDYVHLDLSGEFSVFAKVVIGAAWLAGMSLLWFWKSNRIRVGWVALACAVAMVTLRNGVLLNMGHGAPFNVRRALVMEPLLVLLAMSVVRAGLEQAQSGYWKQLEARLYGRSGSEGRGHNVPLSVLSTLRTFGVSFVLGMLHFALPETATFPKLLSRSSNPFRGWALLLGGLSGSSVVLTGSMHSLYIVTVAYDDISWVDFAVNNLRGPICVVVVVLVATALALGALFSKHCHRSVGSGSFSELALNDEEGEDKPGDAHTVITAGEEEEEPSMSSYAEQEDALEAAATGNNTEISDDTAETSPGSFCHLLALFAVVGCVFGVSPPVVMMWVAVILVVWAHKVGLPGAADGQQQQPTTDPIWSQMDWDPVCLYVGQVILTASLNDSGLPQVAINQLLGSCADDPMDTGCTLRSTAVFFSLALVLGPVVVACSLLATYPYASPYFWVRGALSLSVANVSRQLIQWEGCRKPQQGQGSDERLSGWRGGCVAVSWGIAALLVILFVACLGASFVLAQVHTVLACSEKLGECDDPW